MTITASVLQNINRYSTHTSQSLTQLIIKLQAT